MKELRETGRFFYGPAGLTTEKRGLGVALSGHLGYFTNQLVKSHNAAPIEARGHGIDLLGPDGDKAV